MTPLFFNLYVTDLSLQVNGDIFVKVNGITNTSPKLDNDLKQLSS